MRGEDLATIAAELDAQASLVEHFSEETMITDASGSWSVVTIAINVVVVLAIAALLLYRHLRRVGN